MLGAFDVSTVHVLVCTQVGGPAGVVFEPGDAGGGAGVSVRVMTCPLTVFETTTTGTGEFESEGVSEGLGDADGVVCAEADGVALEETAARLTESMNSDAAPARLGQARSWRSP